MLPDAAGEFRSATATTPDARSATEARRPSNRPWIAPSATDRALSPKHSSRTRLSLTPRDGNSSAIKIRSPQSSRNQRFSSL